MKCVNCGADISIEDAICPFCKSENPYYKAHREDMQNYEQEYQETKAKVVSKANRFTRKSINITICVICVLILFIEILVLSNIRNINYDLLEKKNTKNAAAIAAQMDKYEANGEYTLLANYQDHTPIRPYKTPVAEYLQVCSVAYDYKASIATINEIVMTNAERLRPTDAAKSLARNLDNIYEVRYNSYERRPDDDSFAPKHLEAMDNMLEDVYALLEAYVGIDHETILTFRDLTSTERQLIIEKKLEEVCASHVEE